MPIKPASAISWSPTPTCPVCGDRILPSGKSMPFAINDKGKVYCRKHGYKVDRTYPTKLEEYKSWRRLRFIALKRIKDAAANSDIRGKKEGNK
jgi:hypothetical protein